MYSSGVAALFLLLTAIVQPARADDVAPEAVQAALPQFEMLVDQIMKSTGVPGVAVAIVHRDRVVYVKGFGIREVGKEGQVDADTVFQLASVSKPLASTVVAALVGEGHVGWDDRIIQHDPGFVLYDPWVTREVTLRDMLCHRSGLADHAGDLVEDLGYDRAQVLYRLRFSKPGSSFRSEYAYTNFGYSEAAFAAVRSTGKSWEDIAAEKLFQPLGMKSTSYRFADFASAGNRCHLHIRDNGRWVSKFVRTPDPQSPAGGASSSARDMAQWLRLQLGGGTFEGKQLIASKALNETHRPQIVTHSPAHPSKEFAGFYGLGWNVNYQADGRVKLGHSGAFNLGAATYVGLLPGENLGIVVLTNGQPVGIPEAIGASFFDLALKGKVERDWVAAYKPLFAELMKPDYGLSTDYSKPPANVSPALSLDAYVGIYHSDYYGELEVVEKDKKLQLLLGPKKTAYAMQHWDRDTFTYQPAGENAGGLSGVTFTIGLNRKGVQVVLENLNAQRQGAFQRLPVRK